MSKSKYEAQKAKKLAKIEQRNQERKELRKEKTKSKFVKNFITLIIVIAVIAIIFMFVKSVSSREGRYNDLAKCLTEKGVKMYGADWCTNCAAQKRMFGKSFEHIDYVECTVRKSECEEANIQGYPTWVFQNGERALGSQSIKDLAKKGECDI